LSHEKTEEDEQKDWPNCVFYPDEVKCPVRREMGRNIDKYVKPPLLKGTDEAQMVMKMVEPLKAFFGNEWMYLHTFCQMCPVKFREDQKLMKYPKLPTGPTPPVKLLECPKCHTKGLFNYCPKCGAKVAEDAFKNEF